MTNSNSKTDLKTRRKMSVLENFTAASVMACAIFVAYNMGKEATIKTDAQILGDAEVQSLQTLVQNRDNSFQKAQQGLTASGYRVADAIKGNGCWRMLTDTRGRPIMGKLYSGQSAAVAFCDDALTDFSYSVYDANQIPFPDEKDKIDPGSLPAPVIDFLNDLKVAQSVDDKSEQVIGNMGRSATASIAERSLFPYVPGS